MLNVLNTQVIMVLDDNIYILFRDKSKYFKVSYFKIYIYLSIFNDFWMWCHKNE